MENLVFNFGNNEILDTANEYIQSKCGKDARLEEFYSKSETRYRFVNVAVMKNFPFNSFKSVQKAVKCLNFHLGM